MANIALFDAFHKSPCSVTNSPVTDLPTRLASRIAHASPPIATINDRMPTVIKAETSSDSIVVISPPHLPAPRPRNALADTILASSSRKRPIEVLYENTPGPSGTGKRAKVEDLRGVTPPVININSSSREGSPASSDSFSGLEEVTNSPTRIRVLPPAVRAAVKQGRGFQG
jgi:hypothetical protein